MAGTGWIVVAGTGWIVVAGTGWIVVAGTGWIVVAGTGWIVVAGTGWDVVVAGTGWDGAGVRGVTQRLIAVSNAYFQHQMRPHHRLHFHSPESFLK